MKVSCVIPTYNEECRIGDVLKVVTVHPLIHDVVVVNDGSSDQTKEVVAKFPSVTYLSQPKNMGKSAAVERGLRESKEELVALIDADLIGLTGQNLTDLIHPVLHGKADISISLRANAPILWRWIGLDHISGERVLPKKLLERHYTTLLGLPGFGLEVYMNRLIIKHKYRLKVVPWPNVYGPEKYKKHSLWEGVVGEFGMFYDILHTVSPIEALTEIRDMLRLRV